MAAHPLSPAKQPRRRATVAIAVAVALAMTLPTVAAPGAVAAATTSCGTWRPVWAPNPAGSADDHLLVGVGALSPTNVIAVGSIQHLIRRVPERRTLAEQWDGTRWTAMDTVDPSPTGNSLAGVARITNGSAWAVGSRLGRYSTQAERHLDKTLIERLSSGAWSVVPSPSHSGLSDGLAAVASVSPTDAWAVGSSAVVHDINTQDVSPLAMHWDGTAWTVEHAPSVGADSWLTAVAMSSVDDGWAVGSFAARDEQPDQTLIERWNGASWAIVPSPNVGVDGTWLSGVAVRSPRDAFAVGGFTTYRTVGQNLEGVLHPLVIHWDGRTWRRVAAPGLDDSSDLSAVTFDPNGSAYAVGSSREQTGQMRVRPLVLRWDGATWSATRISTAAPDAELHSVAAITRSDVITVGTRLRDDRARLTTFVAQCTP